MESHALRCYSALGCDQLDVIIRSWLVITEKTALMSARLINTVSHRFIIFTTFTHNVKIAASLFFLWKFIQVQRSYNRLFFESWQWSMRGSFSLLNSFISISNLSTKKGEREMVAQQCEAPKHGSTHLLTWSFWALVTELMREKILNMLLKQTALNSVRKVEESNRKGIIQS